MLLLAASPDEQDPVGSVDLLELDLDPLAARGRQVLADVVGADRQLAVAAVDEDGELDARRPAVLEERLDRGADRAARVEDVVDEDARRPAQVEVERGRVHDRLRAAAPRCDCVSSRWKVMSTAPRSISSPLRSSIRRREPLGERDAARVDADEREPAEVVVALDDLVRDARERAREGLGVQQGLRRCRGRGRACSFRSFPASLDRVKGSGGSVNAPEDGVG